MAITWRAVVLAALGVVLVTVLPAAGTIVAWALVVVLLCALIAIGLGIAAMAANGKLGLAAAAPAIISALVIFKVFGDKASYDDKVPTFGSGSSLDVSLSGGIYLSLIMAVAVIGLGVICAATSRSR